MEEIDIAGIKKRSIQGVFALVSRTFVTQIISLSVNFLLTIFLTPSVFGVFYVVSAVILFLSGFVGKFYNLEKEGIFLFQALIIAFFISSLKTIPSIILERNLDFQKL